MDENYNSPYSPDPGDNKDQNDDVYGTLNQNKNSEAGSDDQQTQNNNPSQEQPPLYEQPEQKNNGQGTYNDPYDYYNNQQYNSPYYDSRNQQNNQNNNQYGFNQGSYHYNKPPKEPNGMAIAGMVLGIISIVLFCLCSYLGMILGIVGIVLSLLSRKPDEPLNTQAKVGLITSIIGLVMALIFVIIWNIMGLGTYFAEEMLRELNNYNYY